MNSPISDTPFDPKPRHGEPPLVVAAGRRLFAQRAERLLQLAERLPEMREFLTFNARLCRAQHRVHGTRRSHSRFDAGSWRTAIEHGVPPLTPAALLGSLDWHDDLDALLTTLDQTLADEGTRFSVQRELLAGLIDTSPTQRDEIARALLERHEQPRERRAQAPLIGAALQVAWTRLARELTPLPSRPMGDAESLCPCCGMPPLTALIQIGQARSRVRYLHCGLCATEWYFERSRCSQCFDAAELDYVGCEDADGKSALALRVECCGSCHGSLKLVDRERDAAADPLAEDLASLGLDPLIANEGYGRAGFNPLIAFGA